MRSNAPLVFALVLIPMMMSAAPSEGEPAAVSLVVIEVEQDSIAVDVSAEGNYSGRLTGRAYLPYPNNPLIDHVEVFLGSELPPRTSLILSIDRFTLSPEVPEVAFVGNITVLPSTSSSSVGSIIIQGTAKVYPSAATTEVQADSVLIDVLPYYGADIYFPTPYGKMVRGDVGSFDLRVNNTGNANDVYQLRIKDPSSLKDRGLKVSLDQERPSVPEEGSVIVKVEVSARDVKRGSYILAVEAYSQGKGGSEAEDSLAVLTITVEERLIGILQGTVFSSPYFIWGTGIFLLLAAAGIALGITAYLRHLRWKREFRRHLEEIRSEGP